MAPKREYSSDMHETTSFTKIVKPDTYKPKHSTISLSRYQHPTFSCSPSLPSPQHTHKSFLPPPTRCVIQSGCRPLHPPTQLSSTPSLHPTVLCSSHAMTILRNLSVALWDEDLFIISLGHEHYTTHFEVKLVLYSIS
jgi:hypothetical protein